MCETGVNAVKDLDSDDMSVDLSSDKAILILFDSYR